jgi:hypothetical protein
MSRTNVSAVPANPTSGCFRLTAKGRACVELVESQEQTIGSLSRYLHDVLMMCGSGVWFEQLRQFMPPRSLEDSLRALMTLGLIERVDDATQSPRYAAPPARRAWAAAVFGQMVPA